jgi:hypothetical protein
MSLKSILRVSLGGLALAGLAGQEPGPRPASASPQTPAPAVSPSPAPAGSPGKDPLLEFVPREHIPADSAVSFPVDI